MMMIIIWPRKMYKHLAARTYANIASPYIVPYFYNKRFQDTQYGIRNVGDSFMIGDFAILVDTDSDFTIKGQVFRGTKGLWELLTRKNVNRKFITTDVLKKYK